MTALLWAAWYGHVDTMKQLINRGANVMATNTVGIITSQSMLRIMPL
jgi:ankyrin repeat protein